MPFRRQRIIPTLAIFLLLFFSSLLSHAQTEQNALNYFADGIEALDVQDFEGAAQSFKQAIALEPQNLEFQYHLAVTYVRLKKNDEALEIFESLIKKDPKNYFKAYFDIAGVYSREGTFQKALDTLNLADQAAPNSARVYLEKGYVYKNLKEYDQAIKSFNRAKELDPKESQLVYYLIGAVDLEREEFENANLMFKKAIQIAPNTPLAQNARQTIPRVEEIASARKPWYLTTYFNWGYDDNVPRNPLEEITGSPPGLPSGVGDQFQTFVLKGGYKFLNRTDLQAGVGYTLYNIGYKDWTVSNVMSHSPHLYIQGAYDPVYFRFEYDFSYFYAGGKKQGLNPPVYLTFANNSNANLRMHSFLPSITFLEPYDMRTDINLAYQIKEYLDGVTKDASRYGADVTQTYKVPGTQISPRIGYRYVYEKSGDNRSTYRSHEGIIGVLAPIYWGVWADLSFIYMRTDYPVFSQTEVRNDNTYTAFVTLNRLFFKHLLVSFSYMHTKNDSNFIENGKDPYTFKKNISLLSVTYTF